MIALGINYSRTHDSSACIARDGEVLFAVAEERISRVKHDATFPRNAIRACLDFAQIRAQQIDEVCFGWPTAGPAFRHDLKCVVTGAMPTTYLGLVTTTMHFLSMWHQGAGAKRFVQQFGPTKSRMRFVDHHLAHAISAYAFSGFDDATVVVVDGRGAWEASSIWYGHNGFLDHLLTIPWPNSLGLFYAQFTDYLGFVPYSDEWKVMGLAPYGVPGVDLSAFANPEDHPYRVHTRQLMGIDSAKTGGIEPLLGPRREPESDILDRYKNIAFAVQDVCERAMLTTVRVATRLTKCRNLCLAGGVALNSKANGKILTSGQVDNLFIQPAAGDDGVCLGAALAPYLDAGGKLPVQKMRHAYLGSAYPDADIERLLQTYKIGASRLGDPAATAAELLASGKIVGWFQGRMEFGPRALGGRSILADPRDPEMNSRVNNAVKFREWWRPFAPALLAEAAADYLEHPVDSPFMIVTSQVRTEKRSVIPSVTHVDGSARPQTVEQNVSPLFWRVIKEFEIRTGVPVIMNTSFNLRGEPIVCAPTDAIRTFYSSGLDALILGDFLITK